MQEDEALTRAEHGANEAMSKVLASVRRLELENERLHARVKKLEDEKKQDSITKVRWVLFGSACGVLVCGSLIGSSFLVVSI